jgi:hypothetical protein
MTYPSSTDTSFLSTVEAWIEATGEVHILIRHHASAGSKDFEFFHSYTALLDRLGGLPSRTCITVFRYEQLPHRGTIDPEFISSALTVVPEGEEWLAVSLQQTIAGRQSWLHHSAGTTHSELRAELAGYIGTPVAVGLYPPWLNDNEAVLSAVVPEQGGAVVTGIY